MDRNDWAWIEIEGRRSNDFGLRLIQSSFIWKTPARDITFKQIPAVTDDLAVDNMRYSNIEQVFPFALFATKHDNLLTAKARVTGWLAPIHEYTKIIFSGYPDEYFWGVPTQVSDLVYQSSEFGTLNLTFSLSPFAYEKDGDIYVPVNSMTELTNEQSETARPFIHINGNGDVTIEVNGKSYVVAGLNGDAYLDCDKELIFDGDNNSLGNLARFDDYEFPELITGNNTLSVSGGTMEVKPRWRHLI